MASTGGPPTRHPAAATPTPPQALASTLPAPPDPDATDPGDVIGHAGGVPERILYACYGSNLAAARLRCYLEGGTPPGGVWPNPGCRDPSPPRRSLPVWLPGQAWFARHAEQWGGAVAFLDPDAPGTAPGRAYDLSAAQLADVIAQEGRHLPPGTLDVHAVVAAGRLALDDGWYGTCVHLGDLEGLPLITFTAPWHLGEVEPAAPSAPYLRLIADGLEEAHGWDRETAVRHLVNCPGVAPQWSVDSLLTALA